MVKLIGVIGIVALGVLAGCGFRPLYLPENGFETGDELAHVEIARIANRRGQILRNYLLDRMTPGGPPAAPRYFLSVRLNERIARLAVRRDDSSTRANLTLTANFELRDDGAEGVILSGRVLSTNSHSISISELATLAAKESARDRGARDIADRLTLRVGMFLSARNRNLAAAER